MAKNFDEAYMEMYMQSRYPVSKTVPSDAMPAKSGAVGGLEVTPQRAAELTAATAKGVAQGFIGLPGDIESIAYGVKEIFKRGADESKIDAFLRGMSEKTVLPTTEEVKAWLDKNVGATSEEGKGFELAGEFGAPGGYVKGAKGIAKGAANIAKKVSK
jgi:hypothetical protein